MTGRFWLKLKAQRYLLPLLVVVVILQLVLSQASSHVLADRPPTLALAVQQLGADEVSDALVAELKRGVQLEVFEVESALDAETVFQRHRVQGLLVVPANFGEQMESGARATVTFHPAPGVTNYAYVTEQIAGVVVQLKARHLLAAGLEEMGAESFIGKNTETIDLLDVVYEGPALQADVSKASPVYGVAALAVLPAFLHAALTAPTRNDKRLIARGGRVYASDLVLSLAVVWVIWVLMIALFFACTSLLSGVGINGFACLGFVAIMLYASLLAALLTQFVGRHVTSWLFVPLFLLSMTLGGGLWDVVVLSPALAPLAPVVAVAGSVDVSSIGIPVLFGAAVLLTVGLLVKTHGVGRADRKPAGPVSR